MASFSVTNPTAAEERKTLTLRYDDDLGYDDQVVNELPASCDVCGRPTQTAPDHDCKQCAAHCAIAAYRRGGRRDRRSL